MPARAPYSPLWDGFCRASLEHGRCGFGATYTSRRDPSSVSHEIMTIQDQPACLDTFLIKSWTMGSAADA